MVAINPISVLLLVAGVSARSLTFDVKTGDFSKYGGLYQSVFAKHNGKLYVTNSVGRPPVKVSDLLEVDPVSLDVIRDVQPANSTVGNLTQRYAVYGIDVDNDKNLIWVTNTRQDTVSNYAVDDLKLNQQYPSKLQKHPRDVYVDQNTNLAWVSASTSDVLDAFSTDKTDGVFKRINLTEASGKQFSGVMSLVADEEAKVLYTVSLNNATAAAIDLNTYDVKTFDLGKNAKGSSGVAWDSKRKHLYIANQKSNNTLVLDPSSGKVVKDISLPGGSLNARYDPVFDVVYVANRLGHSVSVIDPESYEIITELKVQTPNHIALGPDGEVFVTDKSKDSLLYKFTPHGDNSTNSSSSSAKGEHGRTTSPSTPIASGSPTKGAGSAKGTGAGAGKSGVAITNGAARLAVPASIGAAAAIALLI